MPVQRIKVDLPWWKLTVQQLDVCFQCRCSQPTGPLTDSWVQDRRRLSKACREMIQLSVGSEQVVCAPVFREGVRSHVLRSDLILLLEVLPRPHV